MMHETRVKHFVSLVDDNLKNPDYAPGRLVDGLKKHLMVRSDSQLAKALRVDPAMICKLRGKKTELSAGLLLRMHDVSGMPVNDLRALANAKPPMMPAYIPNERQAA